MGIVPDESNLTMKWMVSKSCFALLRLDAQGRTRVEVTAFEIFKLKERKTPFSLFQRDASQIAAALTIREGIIFR